jgi:hypothetical protein
MQQDIEETGEFGTMFAFVDFIATPMQLRFPVSLISLTNKENFTPNENNYSHCRYRSVLRVLLIQRDTGSNDER